MPAPVAGEIVERLVGPGQLLQSGATQCFTISNTSTVWVLVNVYQGDLPYVHVAIRSKSIRMPIRNCSTARSPILLQPWIRTRERSRPGS